LGNGGKQLWGKNCIDFNRRELLDLGTERVEETVKGEEVDDSKDNDDKDDVDEDGNS
jgi:hypothetical protein